MLDPHTGALISEDLVHAQILDEQINLLPISGSHRELRLSIGLNARGPYQLLGAAPYIKKSPCVIKCLSRQCRGRTKINK